MVHYSYRQGCLSHFFPTVVRTMLPYLPLKERVLKAPPSSRKLCADPPERPSTYGNWSKESLSGALKAVTDGMSVRKAAEQHKSLT